MRTIATLFAVASLTVAGIALTGCEREDTTTGTETGTTPVNPPDVDTTTGTDATTQPADTSGTGTSGTDTSGTGTTPPAPAPAP